MGEVVDYVAKRGGNVVDMAVAGAFSLAVTHPYYSSLGSGGFALVKMDGRIEALDFREKAPYETNPQFFKKTGLSSIKGGAAVGTPGFVAGMKALHTKYGKLSWSSLFKPALDLAKKGFPVSGDFVENTGRFKKNFNPKSKQIFLKKGQLFRHGDILKQVGLYKALKLIQKKKTQPVYEGVIGKDMVESVRKEKGVLSLEDLKKYKVRWLKPIKVSFKKYEVFSMPLPSSGGIILSRALKLIERKKLGKKEIFSTDELHLLSEIMARAFRPRALMGDQDFSQMDKSLWLSSKHITDMEKTISVKKVRKLPPLKSTGETTHISFLDKKGNAVSMTLTLNGYFGSGVSTSSFGIVMNNQMDDFTTRIGQSNLYGLSTGERNKVEGGKSPLSSMTPVIVEKKGETVFVAGGAGGPTIITSVLQTLYRFLTQGLSLEQAISSPRLHHQFLPSKLFLENKRFSPELILALKMKGHQIKFRDYIAQVFAVGRDDQGILYGAHETRREGASGGK